MKKLFLLSMVAVGFVTANAENTLETVWETAEMSGKKQDIRHAVGVNGKFYALNKVTGNLEIWGEDGLEKECSTGFAYAGTNITRDDAGNILVAVYTFDGVTILDSNTKFVIFSPEGKILSTITNPTLTGHTGRCDKFGRAIGDFMSAEGGDVFFIGNWNNQIFKMHIANGQQDVEKSKAYYIGDDLTNAANAAALPKNGAKVATTALVSAVSANEIAFLSPEYTNSATAGNNIFHFTYDAANDAYVHDGFYTTWQYNGNCGFATFQIGVQKYIVYPRSGSWNVDSFWVSKAVIKDTPAIDNDADEATAVIQHAPDMINWVPVYQTTNGGACNNNYTVEVVGEQAYIYAFDTTAHLGCYLFTPDANDISGIESIKAVDAAPVYYNLQGVRVNNPENGIFIEVRGNAVKKVIK